jgi:hypothetical protein
MHNHLRTHGREGAIEPGGMGLGRSAQAGRPGPLPTSVRPPFPCTRRIFNPKVLEAVGHRPRVLMQGRKKTDSY